MRILLTLLMLTIEASSFFISNLNRANANHRRFPTTSLASASGDLQKSGGKSDHERTLYDVIGASPKDTKEVMKVRYQALVKQLHPDRLISNGGSSGASFHYGDLSEINAAWQVLSDPKERRRYDRELAAKEFADGVENFVEFGITTAIPWLQTKTKETAQVVEQSAEAVNKGATQAQKAYALYEMEQSAKQVAQRAKGEQQRAQKLKVQSEQLSRTKPKPRKDISSAQATRLMQSFPRQLKAPSPQVKKDIDILKREETAHQQSMIAQQKAEQFTQQSERQVQVATQAEASAKQRLEQAQRDVQKAQKALETAQSSFLQAQKQSQSTLQQTNDHAIRWKKVREKVALNLQNLECLDRDFKVNELAKESVQAKMHAGELQIKAKELAQQAAETKEEQRRNRNMT